MKAIAELLPLVIFFIVFKMGDMHSAIFALIIANSVVFLAMKLLKKPISKMMLYSYALLTLFGGISLISGNTDFIKIKSTVINASVALILMYYVHNGKVTSHLKKLFPEMPDIKKPLQKKIALSWSLYFVAVAATNEFVWRNFSDEEWITFKVFILPSVHVLFLLTSYVIIRKKLQADV